MDTSTSTLRQLIRNWLAAVLDSLRIGQRPTRPRKVSPKYKHVLVESWTANTNVFVTMTQRRAKGINREMTGGRWVMMAF